MRMRTRVCARNDTCAEKGVEMMMWIGDYVKDERNKKGVIESVCVEEESS